jgi:hypothetical protein
MFNYVPIKHKQISFVSDGGKFKLYTVLNGLIFPTPTQPRISFERAIFSFIDMYNYSTLILDNDNILRLRVQPIRALYFHPIKNVYSDKNVLLLSHLSKVIKIACYSCQILKLFLIIVVLITV